MTIASRPRTIVIAVATAFLTGILIAATLVVTGTVTFRRADSVPCNSLTSYESVQAAVRDKADIIARIRHVGTDVNITPVTADCPDSAEQLGYLRITYATDDERDAIRNILGGDSLGVYVTLGKR
ncbi:hypothetical protein DSM100688_0480 [Bifidobacterium ramosum]|uniref:Uncharacterized protein n=1 Tax=Bifidobacterium ramosum TaxID=1798158 RepID=A0A6L4X383_9BIFI|nr:hypothetical protein [Bifidobacterium ramosum]KAB8289400.1 hypothetical protein DSM100688_0480 [Bifidobacterium ramosum]NEG71099.1 hypothetical protein [Bifidobacterium ramosum]